MELILRKDKAIVQELSPIYEEQFSENSFGFRPKRGQHDALRQCQKNINDGYIYVVDRIVSEIEKCLEQGNYRIGILNSTMYSVKVSTKAKKIGTIYYAKLQ